MSSSLVTREVKRNSMTNNIMSDFKFKVPPGHARVPPPLFRAFAALYSTIPESIKANQAHFQVPNGIPIHLKGGPLDKILFGATVALIGIGLSNMAFMFYGMMYPKKKH